MGPLTGLKLLGAFPVPDSPPDSTFQRLWPKLPVLVVMRKMLVSGAFSRPLTSPGFSNLRSAKAQLSPAKARPTHTANLCEFYALLFLGNVCIPDTQLSTQGSSRVCILHIAKQDWGWLGASDWVPSGCLHSWLTIQVWALYKTECVPAPSTHSAPGILQGGFC